MTETMHEAAKRHYEADMLVAGRYWDSNLGKGCSIGCFAHELGLRTNDHAGVATHYGVPLWAIYLQDTLFEGLAHNNQHRQWHLDVTAAYELVHDWRAALHRVNAAILRVAFPVAGKAAPVVQSVISLHERQVLADDPDWIAEKFAAEATIQRIKGTVEFDDQILVAAAKATLLSVPHTAEMAKNAAEAWISVAETNMTSVYEAKAEVYQALRIAILAAFPEDS